MYVMCTREALIYKASLSVRVLQRIAYCTAITQGRFRVCLRAKGACLRLSDAYLRENRTIAVLRCQEK